MAWKSDGYDEEIVGMVLSLDMEGSGQAKEKRQVDTIWVRGRLGLDDGYSFTCIPIKRNAFFVR